MALALRDYRPDDVEFVGALFRAYLEEEWRRVTAHSVPDDFAETYLAKLVPRIAAEGGALVVAEVDGERAGYVAALPKPPQPWDASRSGKVVMIMELHVAPKFRRQGIARRLLRAVEERYLPHGYDWVTLGTMAGNREAHAAYAALGFSPTYHFLGRPIRPPDG